MQSVMEAAERQGFCEEERHIGIRADIKAARSANSELKELYGAEMEVAKSGNKYILLGDGWKFGPCSIDGKLRDDCRIIYPD